MKIISAILRVRLFAVIGLFVSFVLCGFAAQASQITTTYSYVGNPFDHFHGADACQPACGISGFFVLAGLPPENLTGSNEQFQFDAAPLDYSFSDGMVTATPRNSNFDFFSLSTDATGQIESWTIRIFTPPCFGTIGTCDSPFTQLLTSDIIDITILGPTAVDFAAAPQEPGTWTMYVQNGVPEPSTWAMMILGFCGLGFMAYRKRKSGWALAA